MLNPQFLDFCQRVKKFLLPYYQLLVTKIKKVKLLDKLKVKSFGIGGAVFVLVLLFLYYPLGGLIINKIDTSHETILAPENERLSVVDTMAHLINREVYFKIWTPGLPFIFPSYFLDNMPNFQLGLMSSIAKTAKTISKLPLSNVSDETVKNLVSATELLQYSGTIWMFSPENHLMPVPSSAGQYKKGRKKLVKFNNLLAEQPNSLSRDVQNLKLLLLAIKKDISKQIVKTENHIREYNAALFDTQADDVFYFTQGKLYGYERILISLGIDFKNTLVRYDVYQQWTTMVKSLERASDINPAVVRNAKLNAVMSPNHLVTINYFASRAINILNNIINQLNQS